MKWLSDFSLFMVALIWGATFVMIQNAIDFLPPLAFNGIRFGLAGIVMLLILMLGKNPKTFSLKAIGYGSVLGLCLFIGYAFQTVGLLYTTVSKSGFITGLNVVLVPLFAFVVLNIKPSFSAIAGSLIAAVGLYLLTSAGEADSWNRGDVLSLFCAIAFAFHIVLTGKFTHQASVLMLTTVQFFTVSLLSFIGTFLLENWQSAFQISVLMKPSVFYALLITSLLATAAAFFIQTYAQKYTPPSRVALILSLEPVFGVLTAFFWIGERLSWAGVTGSALIFLGMVLSEVPIFQHLLPEKRGLNRPKERKG